MGPWVERMKTGGKSLHQWLSGESFLRNLLNGQGYARDAVSGPAPINNRRWDEMRFEIFLVSLTLIHYPVDARSLPFANHSSALALPDTGRRMFQETICRPIWPRDLNKADFQPLGPRPIYGPSLFRPIYRPRTYAPTSLLKLRNDTTA